MLVLSSNFKFKNEANDVDHLSLVGTDKGYQLTHEFSTIRESILYKNLDEIASYAKRNKNPVKGQLIVRDSDGFFHRIKVTRNGYVKDSCDVNISIKNASEKKKSFTFNEKMDLLRNYVKTHNDLPQSTTVVNECNLGTFVKKLGIDEEHVQEFVAIKDLIAKTPKRG